MSSLRDVPDAFDINIFGIHPEAVRERGQNADLVRGIVAVDIERGFGFGVTEALGVGEHFGEVRAFQLHARQDVIAGAVDDAVKARDAIPDQTFAQRL